MKYSRIYTDPAGESHFQDVEPAFFSTRFVREAPPLNLSAYSTARQVGFLTVPAGWSSEFHVSPAHNLYFVLTGDWEFETSDGEKRRFGPGSVLKVDDLAGKGHASRVTGGSDSLVAVVQLDD